MSADTMPLALAAERAGISRRNAYRLHAAGKLPFPVLEIGSRKVVAISAFERWLDDKKEQSA